MIHAYKKKESPKTLILLHGTGGNETDLMPLGTYIDPEASLLGIRGNILEQGMSRFFKRLSFGVFDQDSLQQETKTLVQFIIKSADDLSFDLNQTTIIGYSNGANILAYMMMHYGLPIQKAILLHPMVPSEEIPSVSNDQTNILITAGILDQMVPFEQSQRLKEIFDHMPLAATLQQFESGHQLTQEELVFVKDWYKKRA